LNMPGPPFRIFALAISSFCNGLFPRYTIWLKGNNVGRACPYCPFRNIITQLFTQLITLLPHLFSP
jgi:hypothetical protein